jgi:hypothetical protein
MQVRRAKLNGFLSFFIVRNVAQFCVRWQKAAFVGLSGLPNLISPQ